MIFPVLKKYFQCFKVTTPDYPLGQRCSQGCQITLYLDESHEKDLDSLKKCLDEIKNILIQNNIKIGIIPRSDAALTVGDYFSLRNDGTKIFNVKNNDDYHFEGELVGTHFNPLDDRNPYQQFLKAQPKPLNLIQYFDEFEPKSLWEVYQALACTCLAYIKNRKINNFKKMLPILSDVSKLTEKDIPGVIAELNSSRAKEFPDFKKQKQDILNFLQNYPQLDESLVLAYTFSAMLSGRPAINILDELEKIELSDLSSTNDEFKKFLAHVDITKKVLPRTRDDIQLSCFAHCGAIQVFDDFASSLSKQLELAHKLIAQIKIVKSEKHTALLSKLKSSVQPDEKENEAVSSPMRLFKHNSKDDNGIKKEKEKLPTHKRRGSF